MPTVGAGSSQRKDFPAHRLIRHAYARPYLPRFPLRALYKKLGGCKQFCLPHRVCSALRLEILVIRVAWSIHPHV